LIPNVSPPPTFYIASLLVHFRSTLCIAFSSPSSVSPRLIGSIVTLALPFFTFAHIVQVAPHVLHSP
jgi:hypothetical protein